MHCSNENMINETSHDNTSCYEENASEEGEKKEQINIIVPNDKDEHGYLVLLPDDVPSQSSDEIYSEVPQEYECGETRPMNEEKDENGYLVLFPEEVPSPTP